jgi:hypothetical protein
MKLYTSTVVSSDANYSKVQIKTNSDWNPKEVSICSLIDLVSKADYSIHEYIPGYASQKLMIDIDCKYADFLLYWNIKEGANIKMLEFIDNLKEIIQDVISSRYYVDVNLDDISIEDGSGPVDDDWKFSYHVKLQKHAFANSRESRYVSDLIAENLKLKSDFIDRIYDNVIKKNWNMRICNTVKDGRKLRLITNINSMTL